MLLEYDTRPYRPAIVLRTSIISAITSTLLKIRRAEVASIDVPLLYFDISEVLQNDDNTRRPILHILLQLSCYDNRAIWSRSQTTFSHGFGNSPPGNLNSGRK
ncbi:hypothetical protein J6590_046455 [Homalodisca vitripennis]|nr:hypothetical protein J6590_046455 [Homalodisca vitripennis]